MVRIALPRQAAQLLDRAEFDAGDSLLVGDAESPRSILVAATDHEQVLEHHQLLELALPPQLADEVAQDLREHAPLPREVLAAHDTVLRRHGGLVGHVLEPQPATL